MFTEITSMDHHGDWHRTTADSPDDLERTVDRLHEYGHTVTRISNPNRITRED